MAARLVMAGLDLPDRMSEAPAARVRPTAGKRAVPQTRTGAEVALLDRDGVIVWVNQAWQEFAAANGGDPARTGRGVSYLAACKTDGDNDPAARDVAAAIRAALAGGGLPSPLTVQVPCHTSATERWFDVLISSRLNGRGRCIGATVTLSLARSEPRPELVAVIHGRELARRLNQPGAAGHDQAARLASPDVMRQTIDALDDGIAVTDSGGVLVLANRRLAEMFGYLQSELTGQPVERLIPGRLQTARRNYLASYAQPPLGKPAGPGARITGLRNDGSTFPAEISISPLHTPAGRLSLMVIRDSIMARSLTAAPQGPPGLARHDTIVASLYRVGLSLQSIAGLRGADRQHLETALRVMDDTVSEIRDSAFADRRLDDRPEGQ